MIRNFTDHAANERTFLSWVRTAIAVMAFGFIVEKFDLFLQIAAPALTRHTFSIPAQKFANSIGLGLIVVGTAIIAIAGIRFVMIARQIDSDDETPGTGEKLDIALAAMLVLLGVALFFYLSNAFTVGV